MTKIIVVTGQTAIGKTGYAINLAKKLDGELISADSRQIYQYLDIITGKDLLDNSEFHQVSVIPVETGIQSDRSRISSRGRSAPGGKYGMTDCHIGYYLINDVRVYGYSALDPKVAGSSFYFKKIATEVIQDTISRGKIPIVVGGTYLYLKHLLYGFDTELIRPDWKLRQRLENQSVVQLVDTLRSINEQMFKQLNISDQKNPHRLIRKIEIANYKNSHPELNLGSDSVILANAGIHTSRVQHGMRINKVTEISYNISQFIGLKFTKQEDLISKIEKRVEERLKNGAVHEVQNLLKMGYKKSDPGLKTIGYKQIIDHLEGTISLDEAVKQWKTAEAQYARRQYTFMKKDKNIEWKDI